MIWKRATERSSSLQTKVEAAQTMLDRAAQISIVTVRL
jgi:hypothetical protein